MKIEFYFKLKSSFIVKSKVKLILILKITVKRYESFIFLYRV